MFNPNVIRRNPALLLTAAVAMVIILLLLARTVSAAQGGTSADNSQGNTQVLAQLAIVQQQITDFQSDISARLDTVDATLLALETQLDSHDTDVETQITSETQEIDGALAAINATTDEHANPNPFTMSVNTCATLSGSGEFGGELMGGVEVGADGSVGAQAVGNGIKGKVDLQGSVMAKLELLGGVEISHTVCNAGIEVASTVQEEDYTNNQSDTIEGYEFTIASLQENNTGSGGVSASYLNSPQDLVTYSRQMGMDLFAFVDSLEALVQLDGLPSNPTALVTGDLALDDFVDSLSFGESVDASTMVSAFTQPCDALSGLGPVAATICDNIDTSLVDSIKAIETTVEDVEEVLTAFVVDFPVQLSGAVTDISDFVTNQTEEALEESIAYTKSFCGDVNGTINELRQWDLSINPPSFGINQGSYTINPPSLKFDVGSLGKISVNIPGFSFNPPGFNIDPPAIGQNNLLSGVIFPLDC